MRTTHGQFWTYYAPAGADGGAEGGGAGGDKSTGGQGAGGADAGATGASGAGGEGGSQGAGSGAGAGKGKEGAAAGEGEGDKAGDWAPDWRKKLAGDDPKALKQLERYQSPKDVWNKARALEARISSGELKSTLPEKATDEQVKAWRAENGIPDTPDKYDLKLKDGFKISAEDKPIIDSMLKTLHGQNASNALAATAVDWYYAEQERRSAALVEKDSKIAEKTSDELHGEWGAEYRLNINKIDGLLATMPADVRDLFKFGRLSNREPILANVGVLKALNSWARQINPVSTLVPNAGGDVSQAIDSEIKQIEGWMKAPKGAPDYKKYWGDNQTQERYRELLDGRERAKPQRAAAA